MPVERAIPARTLATLAGSVLVAMLAAAGCAHALKEPPSLAALAKGSAPGTPADVNSLLNAADRAYARRPATSDVRESSRIYLQAAAADPARAEGLIGAARTLVWLADHETDPAARERAATEAVQAAQWCCRIAPERAACQYWLGAGLGVQARERPSTGLSALPKIEEAFKKAAAAEPGLDDGGPDRALALLYLRAPGWPTGPGDPDLGLDHARRALALSPDYPPNHLALGEALAATGDAAGCASARTKALELAKKNREASNPDPDADEWVREAEPSLKTCGPR